VPDVNVAKQGIGFSHALENGNCCDPETNAQADAPPGR
jgi:hypothetical protein